MQEGEDDTGLSCVPPPSPDVGRQTVANLGPLVRSRRRLLGLTQHDVAALAGCSERFVHTVEQRKATVRLDKVIDVLDVLGLRLRVEPDPPGYAATSGADR